MVRDPATKYSEPYAATTGLKNALITGTCRLYYGTRRGRADARFAGDARRGGRGAFPGPRILVAGTPLSIPAVTPTTPSAWAPNLPMR